MVSNRISQIIKITLPLISSDPDSSLFISTEPDEASVTLGGVRC